MANTPTYPTTYQKAIQQSQIIPQTAPAQTNSDWYNRMVARLTGQILNPPALNEPENIAQTFKLPEATQGQAPTGGGWFQPSKWVSTGIETLLKPFAWANDHLEKPWAALMLLAGERLTPGVQGMEKALALRKPGDSFIDTITTAYSNSDLSGWKKFLLESTMPLWWVFPTGGIAKVMGVTADALKEVGVTGKLLSKFVNNPVVKSITAESVFSKTINAPTRIMDTMLDLKGAYATVGKDEISVLQDVLKGRVDASYLADIKASLKPGLQRYEAMNVALTDAFARNEIGRQMPRLIKEYQQGVTSFEDISTWLGGVTKQAIAQNAGVKVPGVVRSMASDAYAFWRAGVLTTPWYVMQNYWEDFFRTMMSTFEPFRFAGFETAFPLGKIHIPYLKNMWTAIRGYPMPSAMKDAALSFSARAEGYTSVTVLRKVAEENIALKNAALAKATTEAEKKAITAQITKWRDILDNAPDISVTGGVGLTPVEAVSGVEAIPTKEHPFTRWSTTMEKAGLNVFDTATKQIIRATKGEEAAKAFEKLSATKRLRISNITRGILNTPRALAGMADYGAITRVWAFAYEKQLGALEKIGSLPNRTAFLDKVLPLGVQSELKNAGYTDLQIATLRAKLLNVKSERDLKNIFADYLENPLPSIGKRPDDSIIPTEIWNQHAGVLQKAILDGDKEKSLSILQNMMDDGYLYQLNMHKTVEPWIKETVMANSKLLSKRDNDFIKQAVGLVDNITASNKKLERLRIKTFGKEFIEKQKATRGLYDAMIEDRRAEAYVLSYLIVNQLRGMKKMSKSAAVLKVTRRWSEVNNETAILKDSVLKLTWDMQDKIKELHGAAITDLPIIRIGNEVPNGEEILKQWKKGYDAILKLDPRAVRGISRNEVNISRLWSNERLFVSEVWEDAIKTLASENNLLHALPKFSQTGWWNTYKANVNKTLKREVMKLLKKGTVAEEVNAKGAKLLQVQDSALKEFQNLSTELASEWKMHMNAADYATQFAGSVMGNYAVTTNLDQFMNHIVPFWYFPSRSIKFYTKTFIQKPYTLAFLTRYMNQAKEGFGSQMTPESLVGYFPISIGDQTYFINPFRPWMGYQMLGYEPMAGLGQPIVQQVFQASNMLGIGIAPQYTMALETINKLTSQDGVYLTRGEPMPLFPQERWLQDAIGAASGNYAAMPEQVAFSQNVDGMPDWEKRNLEKELARWIGRNPDIAAQNGWTYPRDIIAVKDSNTQAASVIKQQIRRMSGYGLVSVIAPIYSRRNSEELIMQKDRLQAIKDILTQNGINADAAIERANKIGFSPMMYLNRQQRREIYDAHPEWKPWEGLTRVGINPQERNIETQTEQFYTDMDSVRNQLGARLSIADDAFIDGSMTGYQWRQVYQEVQVQNAAIWKFLIGDGLSPDQTRNPGILPLAAVTPARSEWYRIKYAKAIPPIHPEDYALDYYYSIQPQIDPITGTYDYDSYFNQRDTFFNSLSGRPEIQKYILDDKLRSRYASPVEEIFRQDSQIMEPYFAARRDYEKAHPEYEQLLKQAEMTQDPVQLQIIRQQLNAHENAISDIRNRIRMSDARIEAALYKWGYVSTFVNPQTPQILGVQT